MLSSVKTPFTCQMKKLLGVSQSISGVELVSALKEVIIDDPLFEVVIC